MSEYQRYEFMTVDRPLTRTELDEVNHLSSHIEASATHAEIEYHWGDFKHDPIKVLHKFFDGFLYWANWGSPQLAFRFPHGALPANLLEGYDCDEFVTFTCHKQYDILDIHFGEMEGPDEWTSYQLSSLIPIRDELLEGDLRALYIAWLASQDMLGAGEDDEEIEPEEGEEIDEDEHLRGTPPVPPGFANLTEAQKALADLLQVPDEILLAAGRHSSPAQSQTDNFQAWIELLPLERRNAYLLRLAHNEPGLSHTLVRELRELGRGGKPTATATGERVTYATLVAEGAQIQAKLERERIRRELQELERRRLEEQRQREERLEYIHDHMETFWRQVDQTLEHSNRYADVVQQLVDIRDASDRFSEGEKFLARFQPWVAQQHRRPALLKRLAEQGFPLPQTGK